MNFVDIIGAAVAVVRAEWDPINGKKPYYEYGHPLEIFNILSEKSDAEEFKYDKYPLIALYLDEEEDITNRIVTVEDVTIVIMTETDPSIETKTRYDNTLDPTLLPLYELLMDAIESSPYLASDDFYHHRKIDRPYYGVEDTFGNAGNIGNDVLDAVVIRDFDLRIIKC